MIPEKWSKLNSLGYKSLFARLIVYMATFFGVIDVETPKHKVISKTEIYEIREYEPCLRAKVLMGGDDVTSGDGFRALAGYIFGANEVPHDAKEPMNRSISQVKGLKNGKDSPHSSFEKIPMTAPVVTETAPASVAIPMTAPVVTESGPQLNSVMSFILPSKYKSIKDLPVPTNSDVTIEEVPAFKYAVHRFSWLTTKAAVEEKGKMLKEALRKDGVLIHDDDRVVLWRYNPPWCLPFLRTNEVAVKIK